MTLLRLGEIDKCLELVFNFREEEILPRLLTDWSVDCPTVYLLDLIVAFWGFRIHGF
jgi:hypothetical protein